MPYHTDRAPAELLAIIPPSVARLAVEMSGANRRLCGLSWAFSSSSTMPGSTRAVRRSTSTSNSRLTYLDVSSTTPLPTAWPACDVPPPRSVSGQRIFVAQADGGDDVVAVAGDDDPQRLDLVDAGVGRIEGAA